jgi:hypothetical protein
MAKAILMPGAITPESVVKTHICVIIFPTLISSPIYSLKMGEVGPWVISRRNKIKNIYHLPVCFGHSGTYIINMRMFQASDNSWSISLLPQPVPLPTIKRRSPIFLL